MYMYVCVGGRGKRGKGECVCVFVYECVGVVVIVWVGVVMIAWVRKEVCGCNSLDCCCRVCVRRREGERRKGSVCMCCVGGWVWV